MRNILLVTTFYRVGEKVYSLIPELSKHFNIYVLHTICMTDNTPVKSGYNPKPLFNNEYGSYMSKVYEGPLYRPNGGHYGRIMDFINDRFEEEVKKNEYAFVLYDNNLSQSCGFASAYYRLFSKYKVQIIASPHGSKDAKGLYFKELIRNINYLYHKSFVIGEKDKRLCEKYATSERLKKVFPAGIPSNDALINYEKKNDYILLILNYTDASYKKCFHKAFTEKTFDDLKIMKLSEEYGSRIIVKEKPREKKIGSYLKDYRKWSKDIEFMDICEDDNKLIADAKIVISAPSTMALKPIQLGIPTVILKGFGEEGLFYNYPGVIEPSYENIKESIKYQRDVGKFENFIKDTVSGGLEFNSSKLYIDKLLEIASE